MSRGNMDGREVARMHLAPPCPQFSLSVPCPRQVGGGAVVRHVHSDQPAPAEGGAGGRRGPCHLPGGSPCGQRLADTALPGSYV